MKSGEPPRILAADEYDAEGWPLGKLASERRSWSLEYGPQSQWVTAFEDLPGYYGEGETLSESLSHLRKSLGPRPHYRVTHEFRTPFELRASINRKWAIKAAAARTRPRGRPDIRGDDVGYAAKQVHIKKELVTEERDKMFGQLSAPDGLPIFGLSREALDQAASVAAEHCSIELRVAEQTPWRLEHAAAREKFPTRG